MNKYIKNNYNMICEVCVKSKQYHLSFYGKTPRVTRPIELIHSDVCKPLDVATNNARRKIFCYIYMLLYTFYGHIFIEK